VDFGDLGFGRFEFELEALERVHLPAYEGSTIRGALGHVLRRVACTQHLSECRQCLLYRSCAYPYLFATPAPLAGRLAGQRRVSPPIVVEPSMDEKWTYEPGDSISFGLVLVGAEAVAQLPLLIVAFDQLQHSGLGRGRGAVRVRRVFQRRFSGEQVLLYSGDPTRMEEQPRVELCNDIARAMHYVLEDWAGKSLTVTFEVMTRLTDRGHLIDTPEFKPFWRAVCRRLYTLAELFSSASLNWDYGKHQALAEEVRLLEDTTRWYDWTRYSARQETGMKLGGIFGSARYGGPLRPLAIPIAMAGMLHVGKNTSFGLGRYRVELNDQVDEI